MAEAVHYLLSVSKPHAHLADVEAIFPAQQNPLTVTLPVWTPGSYLVREFARHLQDITAADEAGKPLPVTRLNKNSFQIQGKGRIHLHYRVYANELTVRTSHIDGTHAYFNGASIFLYSESLRDKAHRVRVSAPKGWNTFVALERDGEEFVAGHYDELIDSPIEVAPTQALRFMVDKVPHELVIWGDFPADASRLVNDLQTICAAESRLFGGLPMPRYLFLLYLTDKGRGGLEHRASTSLLFSRFNLNTPKGWEDLLSLAAHEYFHLWNVKRITPRAFVPFNYQQEMYTTLLWAFEGVTSYYDNLILRRAGLVGGHRYLLKVGEAISLLHGTPGRQRQTLAEASQVAWIKHYRPDENSLNSAISYYLKGEIVALLLDLEIRRQTQDKKGLDDVMQRLWTVYGQGNGVPEDGVEKAVSDVVGRSMTPFFDRALRSREDLDYSVFGHVGLELRFRVKESASDKGGTPPRVKPADQEPKGWLGIALKGSNVVGSVLTDSPAMNAGIYADDEIVALDGFKVDGNTLIARCEEKKPGEQARVSLFRRDQLVEIPVTLGPKPLEAAFLARLENPTEAQKAAYQSWLGAPWEDVIP